MQRTFDDLVNAEVALIERTKDTAVFSLCGLYRYELTRELGGTLTLVSIGLNPSTADAFKNDPTVRKDIGFAKLWGFGRVLKLNAYGFKATDPDNLKAARKAGVDVVGPENDETIRRAVELVRASGGSILVSWGNHIEPKRQRALADIVGNLAMCLGTNDNGTPKHELYIPYKTTPVMWRCP